MKSYIQSMFNSSFTALGLEVREIIEDRFTKLEEKILSSQTQGGAPANTQTRGTDPFWNFCCCCWCCCCCHCSGFGFWSSSCSYSGFYRSSCFGFYSRSCSFSQCGCCSLSQSSFCDCSQWWSCECCEDKVSDKAYLAP
ncbi:unnamed protein product [Brassica rapa subsp. trilocularis]